MKSYILVAMEYAFLAKDASDEAGRDAGIQAVPEKNTAETTIASAKTECEAPLAANG